jgi:hypothetical protein
MSFANYEGDRVRLEWLLLCNSSFVFCITCWVLLKENPPPPNQSLLGRPKDGQAASYHGEVLEGAWRFAVFRSPNTSKCCQLLSCVSIFWGHGGVTTSRFAIPSHSLWPFLVATADCQDFSDTQAKDQASRDEKTQRSESEIWCTAQLQLEMCSFDPPLGVSHDEIGLIQKNRRGR